MNYLDVCLCVCVFLAGGPKIGSLREKYICDKSNVKRKNICFNIGVEHKVLGRSLKSTWSRQETKALTSDNKMSYIHTYVNLAKYD